MRTISNAFDRIENELWRDIPNYEGLYQVSNYGRVKSLERMTSRTIDNKIVCYTRTKEKIRNGFIGNHGYLALTLSKDNIGKTIFIHTLVCMAFLNHTPNGMNGLVVNHKNGICTDNRLSNLELVTQRYNTSDGYIRKNTASIYTGVYWNKNAKIFECKIRIGKDRIYLGGSKDDLYLFKLYTLALNNICKYEGDCSKFRDYIKGLI